MILFCVPFFCGCSFSGVENAEKNNKKNIDYTIVEESKIPKELKKEINEKKTDEFKLTYKDNAYLYIAYGIGTKKTSGYSIMVENLYIDETELICKTKKVAPNKEETVNRDKSFPYVVVKTELIDMPVRIE